MTTSVIKKSQHVEIIETNGIWIGISEDISDMLQDDQFHLDAGDTLLVFTDGIVESWEKGIAQEKKSPAVHMYGQDRLQQFLKKSGNESAENIRNNILKSLEHYEANDDITMLVLKRVG